MEDEGREVKDGGGVGYRLRVRRGEGKQIEDEYAFLHFINRLKLAPIVIRHTAMFFLK